MDLRKTTSLELILEVSLAVLVTLILAFIFLPTAHGSVSFYRAENCVNCPTVYHNYDGQFSESLVVFECGLAFNPTLTVSVQGGGIPSRNPSPTSQSLQGLRWVCGW